jgi:hypothetical protein
VSSSAQGARAGVDLRLYWNDVEPSRGEFDWQIINRVFAQAEAARPRRFVVLSIVPGFGTPAWALDGVEWATFNREYGPAAGMPGCLPVPWNETYLSRWFTFLRRVAKHYESRREFRMISVAGPTSVSEEMSLPGATPSDPPAETREDLAKWKELKYTPAKYEQAWRTVFREYADIFPRQYLSFSLQSGLPINNSGAEEASEEGATLKSVLGEGFEYAGSRLAFQGDGLTANSHGEDAYQLVRGQPCGVVTGFQLVTSATTHPGVEGEGTSLQGLTAALANGVAAHVDFLEVYEDDVLNGETHKVLRGTDRSLPGFRSCPPPPAKKRPPCTGTKCY